MQLGEIERARTVMRRITLPHLTAAERQHYDILQAYVALENGHTQKVLALLGTEPSDKSLLADYYWLRAEALQQNRDWIASIHARIAADPLLRNPDRQLANHQALWTALTSLSDEELAQLRTDPPPDPLSGWVELVELRRLYLQEPDMLVDVIPHWEARYPGHPARAAFAARLAGGMRIAGQPPQQVALLFVLAAYYDTPQETLRPAIKVYDTGTLAGSIQDVYQQAIDEGAQFVIGPLRKESVRQLLALPTLPVPILALNTIEADQAGSEYLFQFGLAPEDEAREVARRAWADGHQRAIALIPEGEWGARIYRAFLGELQALGGRVLEVGYYDAEKTDHGDTISASLNLDSSKLRHKQLVSLAGQNIEFEPRRRKDADYIFMLATPRQARLITPQLSFYRASRLPVYATSHVYTGQPNGSLDTDLNRVRFCDMPWILDDGRDYLQLVFRENWPEAAARYGRFHALGIDAWRILPYVDQLENDMMGAYQGVTGSLVLDENRQIHRALDWASFDQGVPGRLEAVQDSLEVPLAVVQ
jgi:outer membrane PBP1 activator LpoA protein